MKILQINSSDYANGGGGTIAMYRLYTGLKQAGFDCKILSGIKTIDSPDSSKIKRSQRLEKALKKITENVGLKEIHCVSSFNLKKNFFCQKPLKINVTDCCTYSKNKFNK